MGRRSKKQMEGGMMPAVTPTRQKPVKAKAWSDEARAASAVARRQGRSGATDGQHDRPGRGWAGGRSPSEYRRWLRDTRRTTEQMIGRPGSKSESGAETIGTRTARNPYLIGGRVKAEQPTDAAMPSQVRVVRKPMKGRERQGAFNAPPRKPGVERPPNPNSPIASFEGAITKARWKPTPAMPMQKQDYVVSVVSGSKVTVHHVHTYQPGDAIREASVAHQRMTGLQPDKITAVSEGGKRSVVTKEEVPTGRPTDAVNPHSGVGIAADVDSSRGVYPFKPRARESYGQPLVQPTASERKAREFDGIWDTARVKTRGPIGSLGS